MTNSAPCIRSSQAQVSPLGSSCSIFVPHTSCSLRPVAGSTSTTARLDDTPSRLATACAGSHCSATKRTGLVRPSAAALCAYCAASCLYQACTGLNSSPLGVLLPPNKLLLGLPIPWVLLLEAGMPRLIPMLARTSAVLPELLLLLVPV